MSRYWAAKGYQRGYNDGIKYIAAKKLGDTLATAEVVGDVVDKMIHELNGMSRDPRAVASDVVSADFLKQILDLIQKVERKAKAAASQRGDTKINFIRPDNGRPDTGTVEQMYNTLKTSMTGAFDTLRFYVMHTMTSISQFEDMLVQFRTRWASIISFIKNAKVAGI